MASRARRFPEQTQGGQSTSRARANILIPPRGMTLPRYLKRTCSPKINHLISIYAEYDGRPPRSIVGRLSFARDKFLPYLEYDVAKEMSTHSPGYGRKLADYGRVEEMLLKMSDPLNKLPRDVAEYAGRLLQKFKAENWNGPGTAKRTSAPVLTGELPPSDHPIYGDGGIMHGALMARGQGGNITYPLDPRYTSQDAQAYGHNGLEVGDWFPRQVIARFRGAHNQVQRGISGDNDTGAYSIVVSDQYNDLDRDEGDVIYYSAEGGQGKNSEDTFNRKANMSMVASLRSGRPVRVLRSAKDTRNRPFAPSCGIRYDGLYTVTQVVVKQNDKGGQYQRFKLERNEDQPSLQSILNIPTAQQVEDYHRIPEGY